MIDSSWVFDIQTTIYSRLKAICESKLKTKYPDITITMDSHVPTTPKFPNVYMHFLPPVEVGNDLDGQDLNGLYLTAQVDVTVEDAQGMIVANEVTQVVTDCMKEMRFVAITLAEFIDTDTEYRTVSRFARTIGQADTLYEV